MDLSALNKIAEREFLPKKKVTDLEKDHEYMVTAFKEVKTRFGTKIVAEIDDSFQIFLPGKISSAILKDQEFFNNLSNTANKLSLFITYHKGGTSIKFTTC
ncbi:uncharacterized protein LOC116738696 [Nasonia vitripennis]|uniref:Uncharacterized protein n=1 Tax=Nasonia vitripennis TaxID=7425 RepID=A0A7M7R293_NASVI|nr:uncharacterized protein LOC116738696 [Nasonia vitripennis]